MLYIRRYDVRQRFHLETLKKASKQGKKEALRRKISKNYKMVTRGS